MEKSELLFNILVDMNKTLKEILRRFPEKTNTHEMFTFNTAGSTSFNKDVHELLTLPKGYYATTMTIIDVGGGFSFKLNGESNAITAIKNMKISEEQIYKIELIPATSVGTAKVRFGAFIDYDK